MTSPGWTAAAGADEVRCRYKGSLWALVVVCALGAAGLLFPLLLGVPPGTSLALGLLLGGPFLLLVTGGVAYLRKAEIVADVSGLRWRKIGRGHTAKWAEVTDYYLDLTNSSAASTLWVRVQTQAGELLLLPDHWTNLDQLRACISLYATGAGATDWRVRGGYVSGLPLKCHYDTVINRHTLVWMDRLHVYGLAAVAVYFGWHWWTMHTLPGWGWLLTPTGLFVIGKQTLPLLIRPLYRETEHRLGQKIVADKEGLRFVTLSSETRVDWEDVSDFYAEGVRYVIVTPQGEYDFLDTLTDSERLKEVVPRLAVRVGQTRWRTGTARVRRVRGADGMERVQTVYHYRSQENCGGLWAVTFAMAFLGLVLAGPALMSLSSGLTPGVREWALAFVALSGWGCLLCTWAGYWICEVVVGDNGLTWRSLWGERFLPWDQVRGFRWRGPSDLIWGCVEGRYGRFWLWKGLGDGNRLAEGVEARVGSTGLTASTGIT